MNQTTNETLYSLQVLGLAGTWRRDLCANNLSTAISKYMHILDNDGAVRGLNDGESYDVEVLVNNVQKLHVQVKISFKPSFNIRVLDSFTAPGQQSFLCNG